MKRPDMVLLLIFTLAACGGRAAPEGEPEAELTRAEANPEQGVQTQASGTPTPPGLTACEQAFKAAASTNPMQDTWEDWFPAIKACTLDEWVAGAEKFPYPEYEAGLMFDPEESARTLCTEGGAAHEIASTAKLCLDP